MARYLFDLTVLKRGNTEHFPSLYNFFFNVPAWEAGVKFWVLAFIIYIFSFIFDSGKTWPDPSLGQVLSHIGATLLALTGMMLIALG